VKVAALFSGCGGLDLGFKEAGFEIVWANDIDSDSCKTYRKFIGNHIYEGDIQNFINRIPSVDVIIGGPPCQSFSLVGKRLEDDKRSSLVISFYESIKKVRPKVFLLENVPGLASSKFNHERIPVFLSKKFEELGYVTFLEKVKALDYFVPQKRERLILFGFEKKVIKSKFNLIEPIKFKDIIFSKETPSNTINSFDALDDLGDVSKTLKKDPKFLSLYKKEPHSEYANLMRLNNQRDVSLHVLPTMSAKDREFVEFIPPGGNYQDIPDNISTQRIMKFKETGGRTTTYARLHPELPSFTVNTYFNRPNVGSNYHYRYKRLISPREALRLQSFKDDFTPFFTSQRSLFTQIGNAVPPLMGRALAESIKLALKN